MKRFLLVALLLAVCMTLGACASSAQVQASHQQYRDDVAPLMHELELHLTDFFNQCADHPEAIAADFDHSGIRADVDYLREWHEQIAKVTVPRDRTEVQDALLKGASYLEDAMYEFEQGVKQNNAALITNARLLLDKAYAQFNLATQLENALESASPEGMKI